MTGRAQIQPDTPAHDGRQRWRCLTRKVVTAWAPFYANVDFDHEGNPVRVHISQPGKKMGTDFGDVIDAIGEAVTEALRSQTGRGTSGVADAYFGATEFIRINWAGREADLTIQDMLRQLEGAITGLIAEAKA